MRNDTDDELEHIPSLRAEVRERDDFGRAAIDEPPASVRSRRQAAVPPRGARTGPLWALVGALSIALAGLGWWSFQQISLMEQQLVATQESFARISEEAAGRIQDISGKVVAAESNVNTGSEAFKLQIRQVERRLAEVALQLQGLAERQGEQGKQVEQLAGTLQQQQSAGGERDAQLENRLNALASEQAALGTLKAEQDRQQASLASLGESVQQLKGRKDPAADIERLEQELLVLRSELDNRPAASASTTNVEEFDAFRAQVNRSVSTLQKQVKTLQQQLDNR
ncbi:ATPase [Azotobacter bryophylli]|uniref:ATPase n=1 Tax=Azotobacter bryophylli TaxID=1986537 RepID=A0ABV7AXD5_9GAMM